MSQTFVLMEQNQTSMIELEIMMHLPGYLLQNCKKPIRTVDTSLSIQGKRKKLHNHKRGKSPRIEDGSSSDLSTSSGPEVITLFSYSTQLSTKFILLINVKIPTIIGI